MNSGHESRRRQDAKVVEQEDPADEQQPRSAGCVVHRPSSSDSGRVPSTIRITRPQPAEVARPTSSCPPSNNSPTTMMMVPVVSCEACLLSTTPPLVMSVPAHVALCVRTFARGRWPGPPVESATSQNSPAASTVATPPRIAARTNHLSRCCHLSRLRPSYTQYGGRAWQSRALRPVAAGPRPVAYNRRPTRSNGVLRRTKTQDNPVRHHGVAWAAGRAAEHRKVVRARRQPHVGAAPHRGSKFSRANSCRSWARRAPASRRCCTSSACTTANGRASTTSPASRSTAWRRRNGRSCTRQHIGFVFQSYHLLDHLTVYENLEVPLSYRDIKKSERDSIVCDVARSLQHRRQEGPVSQPVVGRPAAARGRGARGHRRTRKWCWPTNRPATCTRARAARSWSCSRG